MNRIAIALHLAHKVFAEYACLSPIRIVLRPDEYDLLVAECHDWLSRLSDEPGVYVFGSNPTMLIQRGTT